MAATTSVDGRRTAWIIALCCLGQFMVVLDVSVVIVALPAIQAGFGLSEFDLPWVVNAYALISAGFLLLGGRLNDIFSRRSVYAAGFALFGGASLIAAFAPTGEVLIAARALQGLGTAILAPATLSILTRTFEDATRRSRAVGTWSSVGAVGGTLGPLIGGLLMVLLGWRGIFAINVPVSLLALILGARLLDGRPPTPKAHGRFDVAGALSVTLGMVLLVYGIDNTATHGWTAPATGLSLSGGILLLLAFLAIEGWVARAPLMPLSVFTVRQFSVSSLIVFLLGFAMLAMWYFITLYFQQVLGYSPLVAGLALAPMGIAVGLGNQAAGRFSPRFGLRASLLWGTVMSCVGFLLLSRLPLEADYVAAALVPMLVTGLGVGVAFSSAMIAMTRDSAPEARGLAAGLANTFRTLGGSLGLAVLAAIASGTTAARDLQTPAARLNEGYHQAFFAAALVLAGASLVSLLLERRRSTNVVRSRT